MTSEINVAEAQLGVAALLSPIILQRVARHLAASAAHLPEIWERLRTGSRDALRQISTTLAKLDLPSTTRKAAHRLRAEIVRVAALDPTALIEEIRRTVAESRVSERWAPGQCVYEAGFTYRLVPAITWHLRVRLQESASANTSTGSTR